MVNQASTYLFEATGKRFYFRNTAILIPEKWKTKPEYKRPKLETYKNVRISSHVSSSIFFCNSDFSPKLFKIK